MKELNSDSEDFLEEFYPAIMEHQDFKDDTPSDYLLDEDNIPTIVFDKK